MQEITFKQLDLWSTSPGESPSGSKTQLILRDYQKAAISKILWAQKLPGNDLIILPTGAGKSIVIAAIAKELGKPILILQPSKEILEQNYNKLLRYVDEEHIGIYSASMNQKDIKYYTFATIQSIYKKAEDFKHFEIVIIDECHGVNPKNLSGMFTKFLKEIGSPKVIGLTATPYRMDLGYRKVTDMLGYQNFEAFTTIKLISRMKHMFWSRILYNINNVELLDQGHLCPLEYIDMSLVDHAEIPLNKSMSDFDLEAYEEKISDRQNKLFQSISYAQQIANHVLVFCSSVKQAETLSGLIEGSAFVTGKTPKNERDQIINGFKDGKIKVVFNVGVLTTGFDHPSLDCIILIRPTRSIALYYQMLGRGVRTAPGKTSCKIIDLTSTVKNLGRIETIKLEKIDNKWELISETGYWHNQELYSFKITPKEKEGINEHRTS